MYVHKFNKYFFKRSVLQFDCNDSYKTYQFFSGYTVITSNKSYESPDLE